MPMNRCVLDTHARQRNHAWWLACFPARCWGQSSRTKGFFSLRWPKMWLHSSENNKNYELTKKMVIWDFSVGLVTKTPSFLCMGYRFNLWSRKFRMPKTKIINTKRNCSKNKSTKNCNFQTSWVFILKIISLELIHMQNRHIQRWEILAPCALMVDKSHLHIPKLMGCGRPEVNPNENYRLWMMVMWQCGFIDC